MASTDFNLSELPPYTVTLWKEFKANPNRMYNLFTATQNGVNYATDRLIDMTGARANLKKKEFEVDSLEDLQRVRNNLLTMPIFFHVTVAHQKTDNYGIVRVNRTWAEDFFVRVNTRHQTIREILSHKLNVVTQKMQEGKRFCLKLDFGPSVKQWFSNMVDHEDDCGSRSTYDYGHMEIFIHNYTTPNRCCKNPVFILCCLPFWLLFGGTCYWIHRAIKCDDESCDFEDLPVVFG